MKNIIKAGILCIVCSSVFAAQNSNEEKVESELSLIQKQHVAVLKKTYSVDDATPPSEDVVITPLGQCSPHPFCQQLEK